MKKLFVIASLAFNANALSQPPTIEWEKSYGGTKHDIAYSIQQTSDGGYVVAGTAQSLDGDVTGNSGNLGFYDCWVIKIDVAGNIQWKKCYGILGINETAYCIQQTSDGGYIVATQSGWSGDIFYWVLKLDNGGNLQWQKQLGGGDGANYCRSIKQTNDGGYIVAGFSLSTHFGNHGAADYYVVKLNDTGSVQWQKCFGGTTADVASDVQLTTDGGYILSGYSNSNDGDVSGNHGSNDFWILKINSSGNILWQKSLGGSNDDEANSIKQTIDGGYIVTGLTSSIDGDISGRTSFDTDFWTVKLDASGNIQWEKHLGGTQVDKANSIIQDSDGGYVVAGYVSSNDGNVIGMHGYVDFWILKYDSNGNLQWQKCLGGIDYKEAHSIIQTNNGGYIVAGAGASNDGDVTGNHGENDFWVVKLGAGVGINEINSKNSFEILPNPSNGNVTIEFLEQNENCRVIILNQLGQELYSEILNQKSQLLNLKYLPQGIYFVKAQMQNGDIEVKKFIKQ